MHRLEVIDEGFVIRLPDCATGETGATAGPRAAVTKTGEVVCTYMVQSALGVNDFVPMITRSSDNGSSWEEGRPIWPHLSASLSLFGSISRAPGGRLFIYGASTSIEVPGELFWSSEVQGMKQNALFWADSHDGGETWSDPQTIPLPIPGAAEAPGTLCVTRRGGWVACYAPYNTLDRNLVVDRGQVVCIRSDDEGQSWRHTSMHRFSETDAGGAEAWVIELADGRLLGTSWHVDHLEKVDYPNAWSVSDDGGQSWSPTRSTGVKGQSTALAPLSDGTVLFVYNQRKHDEVGVWLAHVCPSGSDFGILSNQIVWRAGTATQSDTSGGHSQWEDFAFGEPAVTILPNNDLLVVFWCVQPEGRGIGFVRLRQG